jgi:hypothetical protein
VTRLLPVSVEKSPLFTLALVAFRRPVVNAAPVAVEKPSVDPDRRDVVRLLP